MVSIIAVAFALCLSGFKVMCQATVKPCCIENFKRADGTKLLINKAKCTKNDTHCGDWEDRWFNPINCQYRKVSGESARKCLTNKAIGCVGDSQIRDFCVGLARLLYDVTPDDLESDTFHPEYDLWTIADRIPVLPDGHGDVETNWQSVFPSEHLRDFNDFTWQVQTYFHPKDKMIKNHINEILTNRMTEVNNDTMKPMIQPLDFVLWNNGIHNHQEFNTTPHGEKFYKAFIQRWIDMRNIVPVPSVWFSMNNQCEEIKLPQYRYQTAFVEDVNYYVHKRLNKEKLPYFDATSVLRSPQRCAVQGDGLHVKQWVDVVRAQILLNHLCDDEWNWIGGVESFI